MEPEILASPGELAGRTGWPPKDPRLASREPDTVERTGTPRWERAPASGNGVAQAHGYTNGHARPRAHHATWSTARATVAGEWETPVADGLYLRAGKRALDIVLSLLALTVAAPLLALLAILIRLESHGPVFYRSTRIGRGGRAFTFLKLRSMVKDADRRRGQLHHLNEADGPVFKIARDPRVTRMGRFLRTTSLDELPQFWNVLRGEMSIVGPRPPIPEEVAQYEPWQLRRLDVRPGITCLWQISGRSRIGFQEWMRLDLEYIRHRSFALDAKILIRTIPAVLSREGAY